MKLSIGQAKFFRYMPECGVTLEGEQNSHSREMALSVVNGDWYSSEWLEAGKDWGPDEPLKMVTANARLLPGTAQQCHRQHEEGRRQQAIFAPHDFLKWVTSTYDHKVHDPLTLTSPVGFNYFMFGAHATCGLTIYGDIPLAREWLQKFVGG